MKSSKLQLLVTLLATLAAAGFLAARGLPPDSRLFDYARAGEADGVRRALEWGADINAGDPDFLGAKPLELAIFCNPLNQTGFDEVGPFDKKSAETIELLISRGATLSERDSRGRTLLYRVLTSNESQNLSPNPLAYDKEIAEILIRHGAEVNTRDRDGQTLLASVVWQYRFDLAKVLIAHGAGIDVPPDNGRVLLHLACDKGDRELVALLIARGAAVNVKDDFGETPLFAAARFGRKAVVELLMAHGAEINGKDLRGFTPLRLAIEENHQDVADLLRQHGAKE